MKGKFRFYSSCDIFEVRKNLGKNKMEKLCNAFLQLFELFCSWRCLVAEDNLMLKDNLFICHFYSKGPKFYILLFSPYAKFHVKVVSTLNSLKVQNWKFSINLGKMVLINFPLSNFPFLKCWPCTLHSSGAPFCIILSIYATKNRKKIKTKSHHKL